MKRTKQTLILLVLIVSITLVGCWDKVEINDRNFVMTIGIDSYEYEVDESLAENENGKNIYSVTVSIADLSNMIKDGSGNEVVQTTTGISLPSAMRISTNNRDTNIYYGQSKTLILGRDVFDNEKTLKDILDTLERNQDVSASINVLASNKTALECLTKDEENKEASGVSIWDFYKNNSREITVTKKMNLETMIFSLRKSGDIIIPLIGEENEKIKIGGGLVLKDYEFAGYLDDRLMRGSLWINGTAQGNIVEAPLNDSLIAMDVGRSSSTLSFTELEGRLVCVINVKAKGEIVGYSIGETSFFEENIIKEAEEKFEEVIKKEILDVTSYLRDDLNSDALNIFEKLKKNNYEIYISSFNNKAEIYKNMVYNINVDVELNSYGVIL